MCVYSCVCGMQQVYVGDWTAVRRFMPSMSGRAVQSAGHESLCRAGGECVHASLLRLFLVRLSVFGGPSKPTGHVV